MGDLDAVSRVRAWRAAAGSVLLPLVLVLLLVALAATSVVLWRDRDGVAVAAAEALVPADGDTGARPEVADDPAAQAVVVGRRGAVAFFSLDHRRVAADLDRMLGLTTGDFRDDYAATTRRLRQRVDAQRLVLTPAVVRGGTATEYLTEDAAQVLVSLDVTVRRAGRPPRTEPNRTRVVLERVDGVWLVAGLAEVG